MRCVFGPLARDVLVAAVHERVGVQPRAMHDIIREPDVADLATPVADVGIFAFFARRFVLRHELREDGDALEVARGVATHLHQPEIHRRPVQVQRHVLQDLARPVQGQRVAVCTEGSFVEIYDPCRVVVRRHVGDFAEMRPSPEGCGGRVVFDQNPPIIVVRRFGRTVAYPEKIPPVSVRRFGWGPLRSVQQRLAAQCEQFQL